MKLLPFAAFRDSEWRIESVSAAVQLSGTLSGELRASLLLCSSPGP